MSVVIVSNRVARGKAGEPMTGGLAAALLPAVRSYGAVWVGSSGKVQSSTDRDAFAQVEAFGKGAIATVDLPEAHYSDYYQGFSNSALWPALHSRPDLVDSKASHYTAYRQINRYMARALLRFSKPNSLFWIHDYHFFCLGEELRKQRVRQPLGFFLHTPWPERTVFSAVPHHREIVSAMLAYDLIGFQTQEDLDHFISYVETELDSVYTDGIIATRNGECRVAVFPIGIDAEAFSKVARESADHTEVHRLMRSLQGRKLIIGVDRVDYSKGLINRLRSVERMLADYPKLTRNVSMLQIAVPSRGTIDSYSDLQKRLAQEVGRINGTMSEVDWTPIRFLNKPFSQTTLSGLYRSAQVGLVTPLHDGMNLVAKEYIAAQNPFDPGVLVLSEFAGAARELDAAVLVNPHDIEGTGRAIARALAMPDDEKRERWNALYRVIKKTSVHDWFSNFVHDLSNTKTKPFVTLDRRTAAIQI